MSAESEQGLFLASYVANMEDPNDFSGDFGAPIDRVDLTLWPLSHLNLLAQFLADQRVYMTRKRQKCRQLAAPWLDGDSLSDRVPPPSEKELSLQLLISPIQVTSLLTERFGLIMFPLSPQPGGDSAALATTLVSAMVPVGEATSLIREPMEETVINTGALWYHKLPFEQRLAIEIGAIGLDAPPATETEIIQPQLRSLIQEVNCARMRLHSDIVDRIPEIKEHNQRCQMLQRVVSMISEDT
jgi:hypothetical protein